MRRRILLFLVSLLGLALTSGTGHAAKEEILNFHSHITVREDASLRVSETITVRAAGRKIKRGIYRDFPELYRASGPLKLRTVVPFELVSVQRDREPEPYRVERRMNGKRIYVGSENVFLRPGQYTYRLIYETSRQVGFFEDHDELYWNVTGTGWDFPIRQAGATIHLPGVPAAEVREPEAYTGPQRARGGEYTASVTESGDVVFATTSPLGPHVGLTIVVGWPKGYVREPADREELLWLLEDNWGLLAAGAGALLVVAYYLVAWLRVGRDPEEGTIIPRWEPPEELSPAAMRFVDRMGYDRQTFAAAVIDMAVKGYLSIAEEDGEYALVRESTDEQDLSSEEKKIAGALFSGDDEVKLVRKNHKRIRKAIQRTQRTLRAGFEKLYFLTNKAYLIPGIVLALACVVAVVVAYASPTAIFMTVWIAGWSAGLFALLSSCWGAWRTVLTGGGRRFATVGQALALSAFAVPFLLAEVFVTVVLTRWTTIAVPATVLLLAAISYAFYHLLKAPTLKGRRLMDKIHGFRMYLSVAEEDRLNLLNPPERTPELFEKYLPYALALGVEQEWGEKFSEVLSGAAEGEASPGPGWYHGTAWSSGEPSGFAGALSGSFSGAIASSASPPGSSSGSAGGGSSGGGGGGGGGGGW